MKVAKWKADIRDPYCGGWVPVEVHVTIVQGEVVAVKVINTDNHAVDAKPATDV